MTGEVYTGARDRLIEWAVASRPYPGYVVSGDLYVVESYAEGTLIAVMDGLGHGDNAEVAAKAAAEVLQAHAGELVSSLVQRCHESLKRTRGVAMSVAALEPDGVMRWIGVGNVEGCLLRAAASGKPERDGLVQRGGVVGYQLPPLRENELHLGPGDTLILATDGVKSGFADGVLHGETPRVVADHLLDIYGKDTDDSLVLVARYHGE